MTYLLNALIVLIMILNIPRFLTFTLSRLTLNKREFVFDRLPCDEPGKSKWRQAEPMKWARANYDDKKSRLGEVKWYLISLTLISASAALNAYQGVASWGWFYLTLVLWFMFISSYRSIAAVSHFGVAKLVNNQTQNWVVDNILAQNIEPDSKGEILLNGQPEDR